MPKKKLDIGQDLYYLSILDVEGQVDAALDPKLDHDILLRLYRAMVLTRKLDERMIAMQRQGQMGTFAPGRGQEATQIGQVFPLHADDWYAPSYRSFGAQIWRGWPIEQILLLWNGYYDGFPPPAGVNDLPFSIVIGSHVPIAVGVGMALRLQKKDAVMLTNFGDGASSEGDVSEAMNFAAVYQAPVVFVVENNHYAISMPVAEQARCHTLAHRAIGIGMPGIRVDGNDVLAMLVATREAVDRARAGDGPSLIEALTYRMEMHTTADDPKVYRADDEVKAWESKCPLRRFEKYLTHIGAVGQKALDEIEHDAVEQVRQAREKYESLAVRRPEEIFDFTYAEMPPELDEQKQEYLRDLKRRMEK